RQPRPARRAPRTARRAPRPPGRPRRAALPRSPNGCRHGRRGTDMSGVNSVAFAVFVVLFVVVTGVGFAAARWRRAEDRLHLNEWGLGGRGVGGVGTSVPLRGGLYNAYT